MPLLLRKHQIISRVEAQEGIAIALVSGAPPVLASGAVGHLALGPAIRSATAMIDRNAAAVTLSREKDSVGRMSRTLTFGYDLRGSGTATTAPDWGTLLRSCGFRESTMTAGAYSVLTIGAITGGPFIAGTTVTGAPSGATGVVIANTHTGNTRLLLRSVSGTFAAADGLTAGGPTATVSAASTTGLVYRPDSVTASTVTTSGAWSVATAQLGEVLTGGTSGAKGILRGGAVTGTPGTLQIEMAIGTGTFTGETLTGATTGAQITAAPAGTDTLTWTPSQSLRSCIDGKVRELRGCRGNAQMRLAAGEPARLDFEFQGCLVNAADGTLITSVTYPSTDFLRFVSAQCSIDGQEMPLSELNLNMGTALGMRSDPSLEHGARSYAVTARDPVLTLDPEMAMPGVYDWESKWRNATSISLITTLGTAAGNRLDVAIPSLQVEDMSDSDREQYAVDSLTCKLRRSAVTGDDELYIFHT